jgi:prepilin-type N-terminal cleavage/methylation domain-containing protein
MQLSRGPRGFTLTELAVVFAIVALLIGGAMATLSAQVDQANLEETRRRLDAAVEAILGFAIVNRRLPCPAVAGATGVEAPAGGGACTTAYGGFLPGLTIGFQPSDAQGYGVDAWGNRLRYAVSIVAPTGCTGSSTAPHFTSQANLKANGVSCRPDDLDVCATSVGTSATSCNAAPRVVSTQTVAFLVYSTGKNGSIATAFGADEAQNTDGDRVFVSRLPGTIETTTGSYDDVMVWVPAGVLYSRLIAAGVRP